jgi:transcriptional regulator NrdR family protein
MNCPNCKAELTYVEVMDDCDWGNVTYIQKAGICSHCGKSWSWTEEYKMQLTAIKDVEET